MAIIGSISNDQSLIKGTDAHDDQYHSNLKNEWTLVWSLDASGDLRSPTTKAYGEMTTSLSAIILYLKIGQNHMEWHRQEAM